MNTGPLVLLCALVCSGCVTTGPNPESTGALDDARVDIAPGIGSGLVADTKADAPSEAEGATASGRDAISAALVVAPVDAQSGARSEPPLDAVAAVRADYRSRPSPEPIEPTTIGRLGESRLLETSGLAPSTIDPLVLWALNDGGHEARLYALDLDGRSLGDWPVGAAYHDWEDLDSGFVGGRASLLIADTGDNARRRDSLFIYLIDEPTLESTLDTGGGGAAAVETLDPWLGIEFALEDGAHDVESMAWADDAFWLLSKEPLAAGGAQATGIYRLALPAPGDTSLQIARRVGTMRRDAPGFASSLAASIAGVDLDSPTALDMDESRGTAWLLTYHEVLRYDRQGNEPWHATLGREGVRVHSHALSQAEALAVMPDGLVVFTSEGANPALEALPTDWR